MALAAKMRALLIASENWYGLAALESILGNMDAAIDHLRRAAQKEDFDREWARRDPDLEWIRAAPRFKEIVGENTTN